MLRDIGLVFIGMSFYALASSGLVTMGLITLDAEHHFTVAIFFTILSLVWPRLTRSSNMYLIGTALQALGSGMLAALGVITLTPTHQLIVAAFFILAAATILVIKKRR
ncbi:MAG: hypothetical protein GTN73_05245 [Candidatus Aminicenantes bacterium]|nr:hypothetical protein [Candidatus Aminicenantes bacterium]